MPDGDVPIWSMPEAHKDDSIYNATKTMLTPEEKKFYFLQLINKYKDFRVIYIDASKAGDCVYE